MFWRTPRVAQICAINRAEDIPLRFISNREENGGLGPIRLGERQLPISNGTGVFFGFMARYSKRNKTSS